MASVEDCRLIEIRTVLDHRGSIAFIEAGADIAFPIRRVYMTYDIPSHATRAGHAHRTLQQLYLAASGSFEVSLDDGAARRGVVLNRPNAGLVIGPGIWREVLNFSSNACLLVLASEHYDEDDYIRDHAVFSAAVAAGDFAARPSR